MGAIRVNCSINDKVLAMIDEYAEKNCINRSTAISLLCQQAIRENSMVDVSRKMASLIDSNGKINLSVVGASDGK